MYYLFKITSSFRKLFELYLKRFTFLQRIDTNVLHSVKYIVQYYISHYKIII